MMSPGYRRGQGWHPLEHRIRETLTKAKYRPAPCRLSGVMGTDASWEGPAQLLN